ncbi:MAG TPA: monofunctional biosynthetic peptidoglycan transglycosylase [Dongiaceae bacterium]|jgi:monofunctional biosynthetic peptidoglycan transglycosylase
MHNPLAEPELRSAPAAKARRGRRAMRLVGRVVAVFIAISVALTALYRFVPPPITPLMVIRLTDGNWISKDWTSYDDISPNLARAVIASEDSGFCTHWGFDFEAIQKALRHNEKSRRLRGGSTISNQTAKNTFLWPGDSTLTRYARKAIEPYFTLLIEVMWGKRRILEVYLNVVEWGPGVYGAEAAAQYHFHKTAATLTRREAALLAAVLPNPLRFSAGKPSGYIQRRAGQIQARMNDVEDPTEDPCIHPQ